ncbi:MAG: DUF2304 domain-containing protein [Candidatus Kerfeldbacteria bacterium]
MIGIQIVAILFALWMTYFTFLHFRRKEFGKVEAVMWQVLWIGLIVVVVFPHSVNFILKTFSISRTFDLIVIIGIVILFGITFRNYVILKRTERKIDAFISDDALKQIDGQELKR